MNKEPIGLYIFRFVLGMGLFAFMSMLYWSSVLVEDNLHLLRNDISGLKNDIFSLRTETDRVRSEVSKAIFQSQFQEKPQELPTKETLSSEIKSKDQQKSSFPNLLKEDPFLAVTLPQLLGPQFKPAGTFHEATIGKPDDLHPFNNWSHINDWLTMCNVSAAKLEVGKFETFAPNMAVRIEARPRKDVKVPEYWVFLRDNVYWQPLNERMFSNQVRLAPQFLRKHKVTAHDYKFFHDAVMNPHVQKPGAVALRNYIGDIEEIEVVDELTFVVRWRARDVLEENGQVVPKIKYIAKMWTGALSPLPSFVYKYFADGTKIVENDSDPDTYRTNSVWAQNFSEHWAKNIIVSCGAWIFDEMTDREIRFRRNPNHFFSLGALAEASIYAFKNSPDNIWQEFKTGNIDAYILRPEQLIELEAFLKSDLYQEQARAEKGVKKIEYNDRAFAYVGWNMAKPYFKSKKVRQAMTMAIDRERIINQYLNGMGTQLTGPISPFSSAYDHAVAPWPFNPQQSREFLEEEGWYDRDGDGIVDKVIDGKLVPFEFHLTYFVKNPTTKAICEYVSTALKEIGVRCLLNGVDLTDLTASFDDKGFDALCLAWGLGTPPEDPRQLWHSEGAKEPGSSNAVGFSNPEVDDIIEKLAFEDNLEERTNLYHRFHKIISDEQPYTFLFTPKRLMLYREYVQNVFIPAERQDLIPGADVAEPVSSLFWLKKQAG